MKIFLLDLWDDLRVKRLWPVAALLAIGLVAVPVVLSKPAPEPAPPAPAPVETRADEDLKGLAKVVLADQDTGKGSKLNLFDSTNPFKPPKSAKKKKEPTPDAGSGGSAVGESVSGGGSEGGSFGGGGFGEGSPTTPAEPTTPAPPKTTQFTYVIDLAFAQGDGKEREIKGMQRLEMLPNENAPLLLFLGVDAKANNAVFLVDSRLEPAGEGRCKPSADDCSFLYLGAGSEELFTDESGDTYTLRIEEIRKVKVKAKSSRARAGKRSRKQKRSKPAAESAEQQRRPFLPQLLTDLVSVSSGSSDPSSSGKTGR